MCCIFYIIRIFGSVLIRFWVIIILVLILMEKILIFSPDEAFAVVFFAILHDVPSYGFWINLKVVSAYSAV